MSPARKLPARSKSRKTGHDLQLADAANQPLDGIRFSSVRQALRWYFKRAQTLTSPQGMQPRTYATKGGAQVLVSVDGGKGGDFDDVLATMATIGASLARLKAFNRRAHHVLLRVYRDGDTQKFIAENHDWSERHVSEQRAKGETYLAGALAADVLRVG